MEVPPGRRPKKSTRRNHYTPVLYARIDTIDIVRVYLRTGWNRIGVTNKAPQTTKL
jgi:hypothetical protein